MFRFIEKSFFKIIQIVGLLFAAIMLIIGLTIGYHKINIQTDEVDSTSVIKFADYQKMLQTQKRKIAYNLNNNKNFKQVFNQRINDIVATLNTLSNDIVNKTDLKQKVKISIKLKVEKYPQSVQLDYALSLAKLSKQVSIVGAPVDMRKLIQWHDKSFFHKIQNKNKFLKIGAIQIEKSVYAALWEGLLVFTMLIIMLAILRIEQNTRKNNSKPKSAKIPVQLKRASKDQ